MSSNRDLAKHLNNKYLKQQHEIMLSFGYHLAGWSNRSGGHPRYDREGFARLELSSTPRSEKAARSRLLNELRKRHPEHPRWRSAQKRRRRRSPAKTTSRSRVLALVPDQPLIAAAPAPPPKPEPEPVPVWTATDPITDERRAAWRRNAAELARLNAEERLRPRRAA